MRSRDRPADARRPGKMRGPPLPRDAHDRRTPAVHRTRDGTAPRCRGHLVARSRRRRQRLRSDRQRDAAAGVAADTLRLSACAGAAGDAQQRVPDAGVVRPVGGRHHESRRCRRRAGLAGAHRGADRTREVARHRRAAHRPRRILAGRRDRALHGRAPCRAAGGHRRLVDVRRAAGPARRRGECGQSRRADLHGARNVRSDGPTRMGRGRAARSGRGGLQRRMAHLPDAAFGRLGGDRGGERVHRARRSA